MPIPLPKPAVPESLTRRPAPVERPSHDKIGRAIANIKRSRELPPEIKKQLIDKILKGAAG